MFLSVETFHAVVMPSCVKEWYKFVLISTNPDSSTVSVSLSHLNSLVVGLISLACFLWLLSLVVISVSAHGSSGGRLGQGIRVTGSASRAALRRNLRHPSSQQHAATTHFYLRRRIFPRLLSPNFIDLRLFPSFFFLDAFWAVLMKAL